MKTIENIGIGSYPKLQYSGKGKSRGVTLATTFGDAPIIVFWKIPPYLRKYVELHVLEILEHETLHIILHKIGEAKKSLDSIFPDVESLTKWKLRKGSG